MARPLQVSGKDKDAMDPTTLDERSAAEEVRRLVEENRSRCLWFLRPDFLPTTREEQITALEHIERHGDRDAFRRAATLKRWLSRNSRPASADS